MAKLKLFLLLLLINVCAYSMSIQDVLGREVIISKPVKKIVALGTSLSYITYLNAIDKVVGIESIELENVKKRSYTYINKDKIKDLPVIGRGGKGKLTNLEALIVLDPDVIFTITNDKNEADILSKQLNKPVVVVSYGVKSVDFKYIFISLELMGKILDKEKRAKELITYIKSLKAEFVNIEKKENAYIGAVAYKGFQGITSTKTDFMPFRFAQVNNITAKLQDKGQLFINKEFLLINNPKYLFLDSAGLKLIKEDFRKRKEFYKKIDAFKKNSYVLLSNVYYYINIDNMLANSFFIAKVLYPQKYKNLDPIKKADEIFNFFVGKDMYKIIKEDMGGFSKLNIKDDKLIVESF